MHFSALPKNLNTFKVPADPLSYNTQMHGFVSMHKTFPNASHVHRIHKVQSPYGPVQSADYHHVNSSWWALVKAEQGTKLKIYSLMWGVLENTAGMSSTEEECPEFFKVSVTEMTFSWPRRNRERRDKTCYTDWTTCTGPRFMCDRMFKAADDDRQECWLTRVLQFA